MKRTMILVALSAVLALNAAPAMAGMFGDIPNRGAALQGVLDGITVDPATPLESPGPYDFSTPSSVNVYTDALSDSMDSYWAITATGGSVATVVIELADYAEGNVFGVFAMGNEANKVVIFDGTAAAGSTATLKIRPSGVYVDDVWKANFGGPGFGYFLDSSDSTNGGVWYSATSLNSDAMDHMYAYQGTGDKVVLPDSYVGTWTPSEYVLAFEDLKASATDYDYDDFVVMIESINPVPVPGAVLLGVLGLSVAGARLRKRS